jgi:hypothetical protein
MRVCHMHFRYRRLDKCYSRIHSHGEFAQVELCLLVPDTKPFLTEFTTGLHSRYHSDSSNRNIPSFVQINHILDFKLHTQAGFRTQRYKIFNPRAFLGAFTTGLQSQHHRDSSYRHNPNLVQFYHIPMIANSIHKQDFTQRTNNLWSAQSCLINGLRSIPELGVWPEPWRIHSSRTMPSRFRHGAIPCCIYNSASFTLSQQLLLSPVSKPRPNLPYAYDSRP